MPGLLETILALPHRARRAKAFAGVHPSDSGGWLSLWSDGTNLADVDMDEWKMLAISTVWTCVNSISADVAKLPMHLFRRVEPHGRERASSHTSYQLLLTSPNPEMVALTVKQTLVQHALRWGNGFAEIVMDGAGRPRQIWPLKPWRMRLMRNTAGNLVYVYTRDNGEEVGLPPERVFHVRGMGEGILGYSVIRYAMRSLGIAAAAEEHAASVWQNQAVPPIVLKHPNKLSVTAQKTVRDSWNDLYGGKENAGSAAVLPEGMSIEKLAMTSEEAQFLESRRFSVADICRWFRFPPHMAGDLDRATFSNIEHMSLQYVTNCLMTWLEVVEQEADRKLLTEDERQDHYFEHIVDALLRGDAKTRSEATGKLLNDGVLTINEARDMYNLNPVAGELGDVLRVPVNTAPIDRWREGQISGDNAQPDQSDSPSPDQPAPPAPPMNGDDKTRAIRAARAMDAAIHRLLQDRVDGWLRVESDKARRAAAKGNLDQWSSTWYPEHQQHVHGEMLVVASTVQQTVRAITGRDDVAIDCAAVAKDLADQYIGRSRMALAACGVGRLEETLSIWAAKRSAHEAQQLCESIWKHLEPAIAGAKS